MKMTVKVLLIFCVIIGVVFTGCNRDGADRVFHINLASVGPSPDPMQNSELYWFNTFRDYVEERSAGRLRAHFFGGGQLGGQAEIAQGVAGGSIHMGIINLAVLTSHDRNLMIFTIPGIFQDEMEATAILNSPFSQELFSNLERQMNFRVIQPASNGFRSFTNSRRELRLPEDMRGLTFRVMQDPMFITMVEALGARAVPMPSPEMYFAMQTGVVDGQENPVINVLQDLTFEVQRYMVLNKHTASVMLKLISERWLSTLPEDLQQIVLDGANLGGEAAFRRTQIMNNEGVEILRGHGMIVYEPTPAELAEWHAAVYPAASAFVRSQVGDELVDSLLATIQAHRDGRL